jgi:hypothetical protein
VANNEELIPFSVLKKLVDEGVLVKKVGLKGSGPNLETPP